MDAETAGQQLWAQHEQIRRHLAECSALGRRLREGEPVAIELDAAVSRLRSAFDDHNTDETRLIRPLLEGSPDWGGRLLDRMIEEHLAEHAAFWQLLGESLDEVAARIDDLIDEIDAHMAAEERTFLSPFVLRSDVNRRHQAQLHR